MCRAQDFQDCGGGEGGAQEEAAAARGGGEQQSQASAGLGHQGEWRWLFKVATRDALVADFLRLQLEMHWLLIL